MQTLNSCSHVYGSVWLGSRLDLNLLLVPLSPGMRLTELLSEVGSNDGWPQASGEAETHGTSSWNWHTVPPAHCLLSK